MSNFQILDLGVSLVPPIASDSTPSMSALLLMGGLEILFIHKYAGYYVHMYVEQVMRDGVFPVTIRENSVQIFQN